MKPAVSFIHGPRARSPGLPFSSAVRVGDLPVSLGARSAMCLERAKPVDGGITAQTRQTFENIKTMLAFRGKLTRPAR